MNIIRYFFKFMPPADERVDGIREILCYDRTSAKIALRMTPSDTEPYPIMKAMANAGLNMSEKVAASSCIIKVGMEDPFHEKVLQAFRLVPRYFRAYHPVSGQQFHFDRTNGMPVGALSYDPRETCDPVGSLIAVNDEGSYTEMVFAQMPVAGA